MDVNIERNILNLPDDEFAVDFETEKTPVRLGKSDRYFYIDFNDINFPIRLQQAREEIAEFLNKKRFEIEENDIGKNDATEFSVEEIEKTIAISKEIDAFIRNKVNFIFGYDVCKDVFGIASSTSVTRKGEYYFDNFLNSLLPLVEREYKIRLNASNERVRKYTDKKGLHPALKK